MVTSLGTESSLVDLVRDLIKLDFAAIEAYNSAITKLSNEECKRRLADFRGDHLQHTKLLGMWMKEQRELLPGGRGEGALEHKQGGTCVNRRGQDDSPGNEEQ